MGSRSRATSLESKRHGVLSGLWDWEDVHWVSILKWMLCQGLVMREYDLKALHGK